MLAVSREVHALGVIQLLARGLDPASGPTQPRRANSAALPVAYGFSSQVVRCSYGAMPSSFSKATLVLGSSQPRLGLHLVHSEHTVPFLLVTWMDAASAWGQPFEPSEPCSVLPLDWMTSRPRTVPSCPLLYALLGGLGAGAQRLTRSGLSRVDQERSDQRTEQQSVVQWSLLPFGSCHSYAVDLTKRAVQATCWACSRRGHSSVCAALTWCCGHATDSAFSRTSL